MNPTHVCATILDTANPALMSHRAPPDATQASQTRAALALSGREAAAIRLHISMIAPQTSYTPRVVWRLDGCRVWVNGDDGVVRGIEVMTGKIVALLKGHKPRIKVRSLWAGMMRVENNTSESAGEPEAERMKEDEWLVSGGFDNESSFGRLLATDACGGACQAESNFRRPRYSSIGVVRARRSTLRDEHEASLRTALQYARIHLQYYRPETAAKILQRPAIGQLTIRPFTSYTTSATQFQSWAPEVRHLDLNTLDFDSLRTEVFNEEQIHQA